jgi:hypothetical protein
MEDSMKKIYFPDSVSILNPCRDAVFKLIFTRETPSSRGALSSLASAFVGRKTQIVAVSANEPPVNSPRDRQIRFDIACKLEGGELANLEMTLYPKPYEPARMEYHLARLYVNQDIKGADKTFDHLKQAYQISFFAGDNLYSDTGLVHQFTYYDKRYGIDLGGRTKIITVELKKAAKLLRKKVQEMSREELWAFFFRYGPDTEQRQTINEIMDAEEGIAMAGAELLTVSEDKGLQAYLMEKHELDRQSDMAYIRQEGYKKAESKYQEQIRQDQEQLSLKDERIRQDQERIRQDQERIRQAQEQIRQAQERNQRLEEENRRLRGE